MLLVNFTHVPALRANARGVNKYRAGEVHFQHKVELGNAHLRDSGRDYGLRNHLVGGDGHVFLLLAEEGLEFFLWNGRRSEAAGHSSGVLGEYAQTVGAPLRV